MLLIFDEVATGFGRTGNRFVADLVQPDILVLGKALTGGYLGHAVTVASRKVYEGFYDDCPEHALMHGPTFMGMPWPPAWRSSPSRCLRSRITWRRFAAWNRSPGGNWRDSPIRAFGEIRIMGGCVCIEVFDPAVLRGYQQFAYERGVFSRPFLQYLYAMVPYIIEEEELVTVLRTMKAWFLR